ncbi:hypothetical protein HYU11_00645 [Candidatus Woesearchaeota archaeon]|nr:hypothetical protein [Candidatus Woesearchaeota archaeon]
MKKLVAVLPVLLLMLSLTVAIESSSPKRGIPGDRWADIEVGKRDFGEISPKEIVPFKVFNPGGVIVDRSIAHGRMYVWDAGNSRILGVDLAKCYYAQPCNPEIIIGQPSGYDYGACNRDASYQYYPNRAPASASTLCGLSEKTHTTLEDGSHVNMFVDAEGNLYVPDAKNNRVLKYNSPFTTDTIADEVWGQPDFQSNGCNIRGMDFDVEKSPKPVQEPVTSLCFHSKHTYGAGVTLDREGNLWVADGGNNRVLRFPKTNGKLSKVADIVLGQYSFKEGGDIEFCNVLDRGRGSCMAGMHGPTAVRFDDKGMLYVSDAYNNRVLVFSPPFYSGMEASRFGNITFGGKGNSGPLAIEIDPWGRGLWTNHNLDHKQNLILWSLSNGNYGQIKDWINEPAIQSGLGSIGFDAHGNLLTSIGGNAHDVYRISFNEYDGYKIDKRLFSPPEGYNFVSGKRMFHPAWTGVAVVGDQLVASDGRLLFWNDKNRISKGKPPDGFIGANNITYYPNPQYGQVKSAAGMIWATKIKSIEIYQAPLKSGDKSFKSISQNVDALDGSKLPLTDVWGIAPTPDGKFLWVSQPNQHRVFRIRDPLSENPIVDIILGQSSTEGIYCNQDPYEKANKDPWAEPDKKSEDLDKLCWPGAISLDRKGNLYVSDHFIEWAGNKRLLMFLKEDFPDKPSSIIFAIKAKRIFPKMTTFEPAFDRNNRMYIGFNPYSGNRFVQYFDDIESNPSKRYDMVLKPDGKLNDYYGWPVAITVDDDDNVYVYDANRGQIRIYRSLTDKDSDGIPDESDRCADTKVFQETGTDGCPTKQKKGMECGDYCDPVLAAKFLTVPGEKVVKGNRINFITELEYVRRIEKSDVEYAMLSVGKESHSLVVGRTVQVKLLGPYGEVIDASTDLSEPEINTVIIENEQRHIMQITYSFKIKDNKVTTGKPYLIILSTRVVPSPDESFRPRNEFVFEFENPPKRCIKLGLELCI